MIKYLSILLILLGTTSQSLNAQNPTWSDDIACLVYTYCTGCHNTNGIAPFPLETYEQVAAWKDLIYHEVLVERRMPPFPPSGPHEAFVNDIAMKDNEKELLRTWLENELEIGDLENAPESPIFESSLVVDEPNFVIELDEYRVSDDATSDQYRCFVYPVNFEQDMYLKELEFIIDNPKAVHHVLLYHDTGNTAVNLDAADPENGYVCFGGIGTNNAKLLGGWAPGGQPAIYSDNTGVLVPKNTNLVVQMHYPVFARGEVDASKIHMVLTDEEQREIRIDPILYHFAPVLVDGPINVPPNEIRTYHQEFEFPIKATITSISPHAHLICTHLESWAELPDGTTQELITIPNWDFEWQGYYPYKKPVIIEPGTVVKGMGIYDNTVNNPNQPNIPPERVTLGEETGDEMMLFFFSWSPYEPGDEDIIVSEENHIPWYNDCSSAVLTDSENVTLTPVNLYPNPAKDFIIIESDTEFDNIIVYDVLGHVVKRKKGVDINSLEVKDLSAGTYVIQMESGGSTISKKLVIQN